jgi:hypothetical protein
MNSRTKREEEPWKVGLVVETGNEVCFCSSHSLSSFPPRGRQQRRKVRKNACAKKEVTTGDKKRRTKKTKNEENEGRLRCECER